MKVSLITVVYNAEKYLRDCMESVFSQTFPNIEYIVIDGGSTDRTLSIIEDYKDQIDFFLSEKDKGMYDALNKGIKVATGEIIGILNGDDMLSDVHVVGKIVATFERNEADAVYGNLNYISTTTTKRIIRKWISKPFTKKDIESGWMPAHPTLYLKREVFERFGSYSLEFGTAGDYEMMLRLLYQNKISARFLNELIVDMRVGGMSNSNLRQRIKTIFNDYKAIRANGIPFALKTLLLKKLVKIPQFFA